MNAAVPSLIGYRRSGLVRKYISSIFSGSTPTHLLARGSLVSFIIQGSGAALIFLAEIILARILGAQGYGLFATVMASLQVLVMVALLGSNNLLLRFVPIFSGTADWSHLRGLVRHCSLISLTLGISIFSAATLLLVVVIGDRISTDTSWAFLIGMAILPVAALSLQRQSILRGLHFVAAALSPELIVRPLVLMSLVAGLTWGLGKSVSAPMALAMNGLAVLVAFLLGNYWLRRAMPAGVMASPHSVRIHEWLRIAVPLFLIAGLQLLIVRLDIMLLGVLSGHEQAGHYAAASRIGDLIVFALASANIIVGPLIAGLHARNDIAGMQRMLVTLSKGVMLLTVPLVLVIVLFGRSILGFFGGEYVSAYVPLLILVCGQLINALSGPVDFVMAMTGQQVKMMQILVLAAGLNLALNFALIPQFGLIGAASATAITTAFWNIYMRYIVLKRLGVDASVLILLGRRV
ncbi:MAG: oligosaccharide flippase family protein [Gammaproteobacteria bacterium]|nr:oligosaccharide flippase family protein [Gammaproteobacteria bacterium]